MRQTKSLVHFEILYVYSKVSFELWIFFWTKSKFEFRTFFWLSVWEKQSPVFLKKKLSPGGLDLVNFFQKNNFSFFEKMLWGSGAIFLRLLGSHRGKISRWKNLFVFQRLMFLYQLVNLVLETCFIFSKTLKLSKTFLSWVFRLVRSFWSTSVMIPLFQIFLERKCSRKMLILECLGCFTKSIVVSILDFWHISFGKMFKLLTCKRNHNSSCFDW